MMSIHRAAAAAVAMSLTVGATAQTPDTSGTRRIAATVPSCAPEAGAAFRSEAEVRQLVESFLRYRVLHVGTEDACYAVSATDRAGAPVVVRFRGSDLRMVSRHAVKEAPQ